MSLVQQQDAAKSAVEEAASMQNRRIMGIVGLSWKDFPALAMRSVCYLAGAT